jgi:hypothetical protein
MSARKRLLLIFEAIAMVNACAAAALILLLWLGRAAEDLQPYVSTAFLLIFPIWMVAVFLVKEFTEIHRKGQSWWKKSQGLGFGELRLLLRWCSPFLGALAVIVFLAAMFAGMGTGRVSWSSGEPFTTHHALGFSLGALAFCSLAIPILSSARRMPGSFADHYGENSVAD